MSQCLNPNCQQQNSLNDKFCIKCGEKLLLCDRYRAVEYISRGAFGRTFKAIDQQRLNTFCVIKQFAPQNNDPKNIKRAEELFEQEAHRLLELGKHPQIPDLLAYPKQNDRLYLVQEFIDGQDLLKQVNYKGKLTELEVYFFLIDLLPVLDFIHQKNTIHRDIKPENIIHSKNGNLVLIDFGVAKIIKSTMAMGTIAGTVGYSAPEQMFTGRAFPSSDLYSLAVSAIHLLTGCLPTEDQIYNVMKNQWQWREYCQQNKIIINNNLADILDRMLKTSIEERFQSAKEVLKELNNLSDLKKQLELKEIAEAFIKCGDNLDLLKATKNQYDQELAKLGWNYLKENYPQDFQRIMNLVEQEKRSSSFATLNNVQTQQNQFNFTEILAKIDEEYKRLQWTSVQAQKHLIETYGKGSRQLLNDEELLEFLQFLQSLPTPQIDFGEILIKTDQELKRLQWTSVQAQKHLIETYGKCSRQLLKDDQLLEFLQYLQSLPTPQVVAKVQNIQPQNSSMAQIPITKITNWSDRSNIFARINMNIKLLNWTQEQGRNYLLATYNKGYFQLLSDPELIEFVQYLQSLPTPQPVQQNQVEFGEILTKTDRELKRLQWTPDQCQKYLMEKYGKRSRQLLKDEELLEFLQYLESLPTPQSVNIVQNLQSQSSNIIPNQTKKPPIKLVSSKGIDYRKLDQLLAENKWKEADIETNKLMLKIIGKRYWFTVNLYDIKNYSLEDLQIIDKLWIQYSQGRFGFSIQKRIYIKCWGNPGVYDWEVYNKFAEKVGWKKDGKWLENSNVTFNIYIPLGYFPWVWLNARRNTQKNGVYVVNCAREGTLFSYLIDQI